MNLNRIHDSPEKWMNTPAVYEGAAYKPILHSVVINTINEFLDKKGLEIKKQHFLTDSKAHKAIGVLNLGALDDELDFTVAWRNSLDGSRTFSVVSGSIVNVCSNTNIWGDSYEFKRKHTGKAEEEVIVSLSRAIEDFDEIYTTHRLIRDRLKEINISNNTRSYITGELFLNNTLNTTQLSTLKREIENSSHDYKAKDSIWELYNHCTLALKESHPANWIESHKKLSNYFKEAI